MIEVLASSWNVVTPCAVAVFGLSMWAREFHRGRRLLMSMQTAAPLPVQPQPVETRETPEPVATLPDVRARMQPRLIISQAKSAEILVEFMNSEGATGYFTASEIAEWWKFAEAARDIESMHPQIVREALDARGLKVGQRRLNSPEYATVRQRNPSAVRPVLYRIPKVRGESGISPARSESVRSNRKPSDPIAGSSPSGEPASVRMEAA